MKSQKHNQGELKELTVKVEKQVVDDFETMAKNTNIPVSDLVVIAMKRFRSSHNDYLKQVPITE
jgi:fructose-1,6-bisphosphatase/sedoheptulose 1,7-bisphosphatase-like protein